MNILSKENWCKELRRLAMADFGFGPWMDQKEGEEFAGTCWETYNEGEEPSGQLSPREALQEEMEAGS